MTGIAPRQRGTAALGVVLALLTAVSIVVAYTAEALVAGTRAGANLYGARQAFTAAEAGLATATAKAAAGGLAPGARLAGATPAGDTWRVAVTDTPGGLRLTARGQGRDGAARARHRLRLGRDAAGILRPVPGSWHDF